MLRFQTREDGTTCSVRQSAEPPCEGPRAQSPGRGHCGHRIGTGRGSARPRAVAWTLCPAGEAQGPRRLEREAEVTSALGGLHSRAGRGVGRSAGQAARSGGLAAPGGPCQSDPLARQGRKVCGGCRAGTCRRGGCRGRPWSQHGETSRPSQEL